MRLEPGYLYGPAFDCLSRMHDLEPGERVVDLGVDLETLPPTGRLQIAEGTAQTIARTIGWADPTHLNVELAQLRRSLADVVAERDNLRRSLKIVGDALVAQGWTPPVEVSA